MDHARRRRTTLTYGSSPALADGVLVVFLNGLYGLDAKTGKLLWEQPRVRNNVGAAAGGDARRAGRCSSRSAATSSGPRDGELLFRPRGSSAAGDTGWSPPVHPGRPACTCRSTA